MDIITAINKVEKRISDGVYDFLVNFQYDAKFSIVHIVETLADVNYNLEGWHLWVIKKQDEEVKEPAFLQLVNNEYGRDHHNLTNDEIRMFFEFFLGNGYKMNKIK